ncbi:MAG: flagella accessory protein C [Candidatus Woesearchaeota archaeon]
MISNFLSKLNKDELNTSEVQESQNTRLERLEKIMSIMLEELKNLLTLHDSLNKKVKDIESQIRTIKLSVDEVQSKINVQQQSKEEIDKRFAQLESRMSKFVSLYEAVTNIYNPFVKKSSLEKLSNKAADSEKDRKKGLIISDSIEGVEKVLENVVSDTQEFQKIDLPPGNSVTSDLPQREMLYLKYSQEKFPELLAYLEKYKINETLLRDLLKSLITLEVKDELIYNNEKLSIEQIVDKIYFVLDEFNFSSIKSNLLKTFEGTPFYSYIFNAKDVNSLRRILLMILVNYYIATRR